MAFGVRISRRKRPHGRDRVGLERTPGHRRRRSRPVGRGAAGQRPRSRRRLGRRGARTARVLHRERRTIRETLRVFLRAGSSFKAAAEELHLHSNSVKYRVHRAIERRGRPINDGRLDIEIALLLCHWYGNAVLTNSA